MEKNEKELEFAFNNALAIAQGEGVKLEQKDIAHLKLMFEEDFPINEIIKKIVSNKYEEME